MCALQSLIRQYSKENAFDQHHGPVDSLQKYLQ